MCINNLFKKKYKKLKLYEKYNIPNKTVINTNQLKIKILSNDEKINIINMLKYVESIVIKEYIQLLDTDTDINKNINKNKNNKCVFYNTCRMKFKYPGEIPYNYKSMCGFIWPPFLEHYIIYHDIDLSNDFINFLYNFNSKIEKNKISEYKLYYECN